MTRKEWAHHTLTRVVPGSNPQPDEVTSWPCPSQMSGITTADDLEWLELPPGMGGGYPIAADANRYRGTLTLGSGDAFDFHHHPSQDEVIYVIEGSMEGWVSPLLPDVDEDRKMSDGHGWAMVDVSEEQPWASIR